MIWLRRWRAHTCLLRHQNRTKLTESAVRALNSIFEQWGTQAVLGLWNISGEPCSGSAINGTEFENPNNNNNNNRDLNPAIVCNCTYDNGTTCHITKLYIDDNYFTGHLPAFIGNMSALTELSISSNSFSGPIPKELGNLKELTVLDIGSNHFSGTLPPELGNLVKLKTLSISYNSFSGPIPKELGNLKELTLLDIGSNHFSGALPPELGNLVKLTDMSIYRNYFTGPLPAFIDNMSALTELSISSNSFSGPIPKELGNLKELTYFSASDNPFSGKIPDFIGSWTNLTSLQFQGNSFEGPIPTSFSRLTSLTYLRISDIYNGSSSLDFIKNLKSLIELKLRNALISGTIPSDIGEYQSLVTLDLSFNNLTGRLPSSLFNLSSLTYLFLGNNSLSGPLPSKMSYQPKTIDLSYNFLSGSFPQWVTAISDLNLVVNNFTFDSSNINTLPGLNCLQRNFPCNRNTPQYSGITASFSINCGGQQMTGNDGILYESDDSELGLATFSVTDNWAVSNVDSLSDHTSSVNKTLAQVTGTDGTPKLFQTSRMSTGSLRYYGLGLKNGLYTVTLHFAETVYESRTSQNWQSLGRRVFDIYIQGTQRTKDFDISKEAGGVNRAVVRKFNVNVLENYLEIHLFWAGKGTCCIPNYGDYGPLIAAVHAASDFTKKSNTGLIVGIAILVGVVSLLLIFAILYMRRKKSEKEDDEDILGLGPRPYTFSYVELRTATEDFNPSNKLGEGGYGPVYKGTLSDGRVVAVKQLSVSSHQGKSQFVSEIATISAVQHRNLVKLYGCCIEGRHRILVYEYLENKSLDQALFGTNLSTFRGYLAPEYALCGHLTEKADVFGFGVVVLEILSGRPNSYNNLDPEKISLLEWVWTLHENDQTLGLVDPRLTEFDETEATRLIRVALMCTQGSPMARPSMSRVVAMLSGDIDIGIVMSKPSYLTDYDFKDVTTSLTSRFLVEDDTPSASSKGSNVGLNYQLRGNNASGANTPWIDHAPSVNVTQSLLAEIRAEGR
ncbi:hypothetical protein C1H46_015725 [Malus baccata]|uniref:non-specific serine/threonine protein kinase n=1 Tax=Malus baccata TaxID=106549 RepID=A0A540MIP8_MALBA|nr:hypothetical protein C1H46_015725 [Malus baccata]